MRRLICVALAMLAGCMPGLQARAEIRDPGAYFFNETFGDFVEELETARENGKQGVLIMFVMDECPYCHRMRTTVLNRKEVQDYFREHFLNFQVDIEGDVEITDFDGNRTTEKDFAFKQHRVRATPVFAFFDLEGRRVARYIGATTDLDEFLLLGEFVVKKEYENMSFNRYKRARNE